MGNLTTEFSARLRTLTNGAIFLTLLVLALIHLQVRQPHVNFIAQVLHRLGLAYAVQVGVDAAVRERAAQVLAVQEVRVLGVRYGCVWDIQTDTPREREREVVCVWVRMSHPV